MALRFLFSVISVLLPLFLYAQGTPKHEFRAVWIATVANIDWPSRPGLSPEAQRAEFRRILDHHQLLGINALIVQVRPCADAFFPSGLEPWSEWLSGAGGLGPEPYYDPLAFMIEEAHERAMEFHAWLNPYRAVMDAEKFYRQPGHPRLETLRSLPDSLRLAVDPAHPVYRHPEWYVQYGDRLYFDPGLPEVMGHISRVTADLVRRYDLDAIHMDDYFYPYKLRGQEFPDTLSFRRYGGSFYPGARDDWRRSNVDAIVRILGDSIRSIKPWVKFGISPFGVWRNASADPRGSQTTAGTSNYDDLYADILLWLEQGWIDYVVPQLYWPFGHPAADYGTLARWWNDQHAGRHVYTGQGVYRVDGQSETAAWRDPEEIIRQIDLNRSLPHLKGSAWFSSRSLEANKLGVRDRLVASKYRYPALVPPMPWIDSIAPAPAESLGVRVLGEGLLLEWPGSEAARRIVVYRKKGRKAPDLGDPTQILTVLNGRRTWYHDRSADKGKMYFYSISFTDRSGNESLPTGSGPVRFRP
jgi:uncharacterized lipoprotein YddW (UPF0748 family)